MSWGADLPTIDRYTVDPMLLGSGEITAEIGSIHGIWTADYSDAGGGAAQTHVDAIGMSTRELDGPGRAILQLDTVQSTASGQLLLAGPHALIAFNGKTVPVMSIQSERGLDRGAWSDSNSYVAGDLVYHVDPFNPGPVRLWVLLIAALAAAPGDPEIEPSSASEFWGELSSTVPMIIVGDGSLPAPNSNNTPGAPGSWYYRNNGGTAQAFVKASAADGNWTAVTIP